MKNMNLNVLVKLLGINPNTLRGWERRYQAVSPKRGDDGRRSYSAQDVERVRCLWELVKTGYVIGKIAQLSTAELKKMLEQAESVTVPQISDATDIFENTLNLILDSLEKFDLEQLNLHLQKARFHMSKISLINDLIYPLMIRVGTLVGQKRLSISQEHLLSSLLRDYLGGIHQALSPYELSSRAGAKKVLMCTREGDIHEFGILISAIISNLYRYQNYYLGPNMPLADLIEAVQRFKVDVILLGLMKLPKKLEAISSLKYITEIDKLLPQKIVLIIGGSDLDEALKLKTKRKIFYIREIIELEKIFSKGL